MDWLYKNNPVTEEDTEGHIGFIYLITNLVSGRKYIGKKLLTFTRTKTIKKKRKRVKIESDWKTYYGSNKDLLADLAELGEDNFKREILMFCKTKGSCTYYEAKEQFRVDAIRDPDYYNDWIRIRVSGNHVKD